MAPYVRTNNLKPPSADLLPALETRNVEELESLNTKLKDAEENLGESEISELLRSKAMYLCRIGNKVGHLALWIALIPPGSRHSRA